MKILFIADVPLENPTSGSEVVLHNQAIGLASEGMKVYAITRQAVPLSWTIRTFKGIQEGSYYALAQNMIPAFFSLVRFPSIFYKRFKKNIPFQAAVCHQPFNCISLLVRRKLQKVPMIYVFHSPSHDEYLLSHKNKNWLTNFPNILVRRIIERVCLKRAMKIMVLSHYMGQKVTEIHGIPADRILVNPGGVDIDLFKPLQDRGMLKQKLGFHKNKLHLLTIRNLEPRMGLDNLLQCIYLLKKNHMDIHLIIGGEGIERENLENLINTYGLDDEVTMKGFIPSDFLPHYYGAADFFILPTRSLEGFGLVTPESMACGTPVLGTPVGGTREILSGFDSQFLFSDTSPDAMADGIQMAMRKYFDEKEKYNELRHRCREYAEKNYSWKQHIDQLKSILEGIISV